MTDRNGILDTIEGLLGSEGTRTQAEAVLEIMSGLELITFDAAQGYTITPVEADEWLAILADADMLLKVD